MESIAPLVWQVARSFRARPGYFLVSASVLGVSIAALLASVSVIYALLLRPPTARAPEELAFVRSSLPGGLMSYPDFRDIQDRTTSFSACFTYYFSGRSSLTIGDDVVPVRCGIASGTFFPTLDFAPGSGRLFGPADDVANGDPVAVISYEFSRQNALAVGAVIKINTFPFTVVGVLPPDFRGISRTVQADAWIPIAQLGAVSPTFITTNRGSQSQLVGGRLKPGVSLAAANAELAVIAQSIQQENSRVNYGMALNVESFAKYRYTLDDAARGMVLLGALVWLLFALAFTNFFALTLLRMLTRQREVAVKIAMGATRGHLARWLLAELGLIAAAAMAIGAGLGWVLLRLLQLDPSVRSLATIAGIRVDGPVVLVVTTAVALCVGVVWLLTLRQTAHVDVLASVKESASAPRRNVAFASLFAVQFAIALFLLTTAVAFADAMRTLAARAYPFHTDNVLLFDVNFRHLGVQNNQRVSAADNFLARLRATPGVIAAGASSGATLANTGWTNMIVRDRDPNLEADKGFANWNVVTSDYFAATGIRFLQGRGISAAEIVSGAKIGVVNAAAVRRYWPEGDVIGQTFKPWAGAMPHVIVGVVDDVPTDIRSTPLPHIFIPWGQSSPTALVFYVQVQRDSAAMRQAVTDSLRGVWPYKNPPVLRSVRDQIGAAGAELASAMRIILWLAVFAILVTVCGLYFYSSYTAAQTMKDSAIRQALGARARHLLGAHLGRYRAGLVVGVIAGIGLVLGTRGLFTAIGITAVPIQTHYVVIAIGMLGAIALIGLCAPLQKVWRLDLSRTLKNGE